MKKLSTHFVSSISCQVRKCHSQTFGLRSTYLPPSSRKPHEKSEEVTAIVFADGIDRKYDDLIAKFYTSWGFGTNVASLPIKTVFTYDQESQKLLAKELVEFVVAENTGKKLFTHVKGLGFHFYKHFAREIKNHPSG